MIWRLSVPPSLATGIDEPGSGNEVPRLRLCSDLERDAPIATPAHAIRDLARQLAART